MAEAQARMQKCVEAFQGELGKIRTGRANPSLLDHIRVPYYGSDTPLAQVASVSVSDAQTLTVTPWEKSMVAVLEKALRASDLGLNPVVAGLVIRVPLPAMTEERRKELVKVIRQLAENARVAVRNVRRDTNAQFKQRLKDKQLSEDDAHRAEERSQKMTDQTVGTIDQLLSKKETELLTV